MMDRFAELDPHYFYNAANRFWGMFFADAPLFYSDLDRSKREFEEAIRTDEYFLGNMVSYADYYSIEKRDSVQFKKTLDDALAAPVNKVEEIRAENILDKKRAADLMSQFDKIFK